MSDGKARARSHSEIEEEFFRTGTEAEPTERVETFADLDEGYRPASFWRRLFGRPARR